MEIFFQTKISYVRSFKENPINQCYYDETSDQLIVEAIESRITSFKQFMKSSIIDHVYLSSYYKYIIISSKEGIFIQNIDDKYIYLASSELKRIYTYPKNSIFVSNNCKKYFMLKYGKLYCNEIDKNKEIIMKDINISNNFYITWNHNTNFIALCEKEFDIFILNTNKGNVLTVLENTSNSFCCNFNFNSNYLFVGYKKSIKVFNTSSGKIFSINRFSGIMRQNFFMSQVDNRYIICVETDDKIFLKSYNINGEELSNCFIKDNIKYGSWSKDSSKLAISFELITNDISIYEIGMKHISILYTFQSCLYIQSISWSLDNADLYYVCSNSSLREAKLVIFHYSKMKDYIDTVLSKPNLVFLEELQYHPFLICYHKDVQETLKYFSEGI
jgi:hypothetical protein